jgi:Flp pilus assembly protein TadD
MPTISQALASAIENHQAGRWQQAEAIYRQILAQVPDHLDATHLLGTLAMQTGRTAEGLPLLERAAAAQPTNVTFATNLAAAYISLGRAEEALALLQTAVAHDPGHAIAHYHLGLAHAAGDRLDSAIAAYRRAAELDPTMAAARNNLGDALRIRGRLAEAAVELDAAVAADPQSPYAHYNRALVWLAQGRLPEAWAEYEWRWRCREFPQRKLDAPRWDGASLNDKTLLVHAEQGLGDGIQMVRYLPLVRQRVRHVRVHVPPQLAPLFESSGIADLVLPGEAASFDLHVPMASLPFVFGTTLATIPADVPYLRAESALVAQWRTRLAEYPGFRVGIAWQGSPTYREDRYRSIPLERFSGLADVHGVTLVSLQKGPGCEQLTAGHRRFEIVDLGSEVDRTSGPFLDTAAIMQNLDLVITSDTSIAHLGGALGVPVWVALGASPDWRWLTDRADSPWYPTMRLFRQTVWGRWDDVFAEMSAALAERIGPTHNREVRP